MARELTFQFVLSTGVPPLFAFCRVLVCRKASGSRRAAPYPLAPSIWRPASKHYHQGPQWAVGSGVPSGQALAGNRDEPAVSGGGLSC